jgi:hypothetical protein
MNKLKILPADIDKKIGDLADKIMQNRINSNFALVMTLYEKSWQLIPEPKEQWEFEPQAIARGAVEEITENLLAKNLDVWLERMYLTYFDQNRQDLLLNMLEAKARIACGYQEEAILIFKKVYTKGGPAWFNGPDQIYLELVT